MIETSKRPLIKNKLENSFNRVQIQLSQKYFTSIQLYKGDSLAMVEPVFYIRTPESESDWESYYNLRWELLRKPWDKPRGSEKDEKDADAYHVMVVDQDDNIIGVGRVHFNNEAESQVRYMAVKDEWTQKGIGSLILTKLEQYSKDNGASKIMLYARENAIDFYLKRGYFNQGPAHNLYGEIPHLFMTKTLVNGIER